MKEISKIKNGLIFEKCDSINIDLIEKIKNDYEGNSKINVFQTLEWILSTKTCSKNIRLILIIGFYEKKVSYILPIQKLFENSDLFYSYINPIFSDYTQPYFAKKIYPKNFYEYRGLIEESIKTFTNPKILFLRNQKNIFNLDYFKNHLTQYKFTNSYYIDSNKFNLKKSFQKRIKYYDSRISREFKDYSFENFKISNKNKDIKNDIKYIINLKNKQYERTNSKKRIKSDLWEIFSESPYENPCLYISIVRINSQIASGVISLIFNKVVYYLLPVYDVKFKKYSIGIHHLNKIINFAKENNINGIDLTIGDEQYKSKFNTDKYSLYSGFYTNKVLIKPLLVIIMFIYKLINTKLLKFFFNKIKGNIKY